MKPDTKQVEDPTINASDGTIQSKPVTASINPLEISYESERASLKFGTLMSAYLIFQSTVGISIFTLQQPFNQAGILWSLVISCFCCYITTYGLITLLVLVKQIELDQKVEKRFQNLYSATVFLKGPHVGVLKWLMTTACLGMMLTSSVSNLMLTTQSMQDFLPQGKTTLLIWFSISILLFFIIEPEKIKGFTRITTIVVLIVALIFTAMNFIRPLSGQSTVKLSEIKLFDFSNTFKLTGNLIYAFELCSCYLSLRLTSSEHVKYGSLTRSMMISITIIYFIVGGSFSLAFKPEEIDENAFNIYKTGVFRFFAGAYMLNTVYNFLTNTIFACEIFETIGFVRRHLVDDKDSLQRKNLVVMRLLMWTFTVVLSLVSGDKVTNFLNFSGSVFSPMVGFVGPLVYFYTYKHNKKEMVPIYRRVHDAIYLLVCIWISYKGLSAVL